jgi:hypothetical protein
VEEEGTAEAPAAARRQHARRETDMTTLTPAAVFPVPGTPDWQVMTEDAVWVSNGPKNRFTG